MRVAFYAPLKPPTHPAPSGDRHMARLLMAVLQQAGHEVELAARLRSWDGRGDSERQRRLQQLGEKLARRYLRRLATGAEMLKPDLWFTYHLYHKAPDWIGPIVSRALAIPYVVAEASHAPKQAQGPWAEGFAAAEKSIRQAAAVVAVNSKDVPCLRRLAKSERLFQIRPFLDTAPYKELPSRDECRARVRRMFGLEAEQPWLLTVAMMREGDKHRSYELLAQALQGLLDRDWQLLVVGDGVARAQVEIAFAPLTEKGRVVFAGARDAVEIRQLTAACDVYVWPAVNEAFGMAFLEAQAAGLPVVAGRYGGVADVVDDGEDGLLTAPGDQEAFANAVSSLLQDPDRRRRMGAAARERVLAGHGLEGAAARIDQIIQPLVP